MPVDSAGEAFQFKLELEFDLFHAKGGFFEHVLMNHYPYLGIYSTIFLFTIVHHVSRSETESLMHNINAHSFPALS